MEYPKYLNDLIESLSCFPGIGRKSATRMAFQIIEMAPEQIDMIVESFKNLNDEIRYCSKCHNLSEADLCSICQDKSRDASQICVVSHYKDIYAIENINDYERYFNGYYHVLNGNIAINKGITPDKMNFASLLAKLDGSITEIIIATNPTIEGETTAIYLNKLLEDYPVNVTRIAYGLPMGANIDYVDQRTMSEAFSNRKKLNK